MNHTTSFHAMIMAGGSGTRFWPYSRSDRPKQVLPMLEGKPMLRLTLERLIGMAEEPTVWVVTGRRLERVIRDCLPDLAEQRFLVEAEPRDTAPCIALACARVLADEGEDAVVAFLPSDHMIHPTARFQAALSTLFQRARQSDALLCMGIRPTRPATGYGYIRQGEELSGRTAPARDDEPCLHRVDGFVEKPSLERAQHYLEDGKYLWNGGLFVWRIGAFLAQTDEHAKALAQGTRHMAEAFRDSNDNGVEVAFRELPKISIDYALLEKSQHVEVLPVDFAWDDIGNFTALEGLIDKDASGNCVLLSENSQVLAREATGNILVSNGDHLLAVLGVEGLVLVHSKDVTLLCPKDRVEDVKKLVQDLEDSGRARFL